MTVRANASIDVVRRNIEAVQNGGNVAVLDEIFADDFTDHTPQQGVTATRTATVPSTPDCAASPNRPRGGLTNRLDP